MVSVTLPLLHTLLNTIDTLNVVIVILSKLFSGVYTFRGCAPTLTTSLIPSQPLVPSLTQSVFLCYDVTLKRVFVSRHVKFVKHVFPFTITSSLDSIEIDIDSELSATPVLSWDPLAPVPQPAISRSHPQLTSSPLSSLPPSPSLVVGSSTLPGGDRPFSPPPLYPLSLLKTNISCKLAPKIYSCHCQCQINKTQPPPFRFPSLSLSISISLSFVAASSSSVRRRCEIEAALLWGDRDPSAIHRPIAALCRNPEPISPDRWIPADTWPIRPPPPPSPIRPTSPACARLAAPSASRRSKISLFPRPSMLLERVLGDFPDHVSLCFKTLWYLTELLAERQKLNPFVPVLPHSFHLLNQGEFSNLLMKPDFIHFLVLEIECGAEILRVTKLLENASLLDQSGFEHGSPLITGGLFPNGGIADMNSWASTFQSERLGTLQPSTRSGWVGPQGNSSGLVIKKTIRVDIPVDQFPNVRGII
ncbi:hypothetical protein ZIOFF_020376 [Zingiber officinale]|uniref:Uncharacterized protein n=1 Tax=Zingiber officinale TaxID=94328 RepID=A0A8J5GY45_ZINOF|nr:hypothetical protein ZIOFF_020376 [Zingiber officinale]